jgi:hypothetical protein
MTNDDEMMLAALIADAAEVAGSDRLNDYYVCDADRAIGRAFITFGQSLRARISETKKDRDNG